MMRLAAALAAAASFAFVATALMPHGGTASAQETDSELGAEIYQAQCEPCHGNEGKGDGPAARFLETAPRDLTGGAWMYVEDINVEQVAKIVNDGIAGTEMEPFGELLLEEEMQAVAEYVIARFAAGGSE
jgi:mono/diheme cytochrome c family protein